MNKKLIFLTLVTSLGVSSVNASPIELTGKYIKVGISDSGTLGSNDTNPPGLLYDKTGTGDFSDNNDYLTPGTPYDYFGVRSDQTGLVGNANSFSTQSFITTSGPVNTSSGSTLSATWTGSFDGFFKIANVYTFSVDGQRIDVSTTISALTDLTGLQFARSIDPDPDVNTFGDFNTVNRLGDMGLGLSADDFAYSLGTSTGLPLALYTNSSINHKAGIVADWGGSTSAAADPAQILAGINDGNGDYALALGFDIGTLVAGQFITLDYSYVMGGSLDQVDLPPSNVPVPAAAWLFVSGLLGLVGLRRKQAA